MANKDKVTPSSKWEFDKEVAECFDDMLARCIPQYDVMRDSCCRLAERYAQNDTAIVDLGCSRGAAIAKLLESRGDKNRFVGIDVSGPMLDQARERFKEHIENGSVSIVNMDLRESYPTNRASVTLAVLTLQFIPIEYRSGILRKIFMHTVPGGALILVEKIIGNTADSENTMREIYYELKKENGYSQDSIDRKKLSLEGVLVPMAASWNETMLKSAGFEQVDCFWRWFNFAGWIADKY